MKQPTAADQARALLALHLDQPQADQAMGDPVSEEDLARMAEGRLPFARRQQVVAQLSRQPDTLQRWLNLMEASRGLASPAEAPASRSSYRFWQWLGTGLALSGAFALGMVMALGPNPAQPQLLQPGGIHQAPERAAQAQHGEPAPECIALAHPQTGEAGVLCPASGNDGTHDHWVWRAQELEP